MSTGSNRVRANELNARRSTGPTTEEGRARASLNRLLHGLRAATPVLPGEDPRELETLTDQVASEMQPQGVVESFMAERVALGMWRLRRAERAEFGVLANRLLQVENERAVSLWRNSKTTALERWIPNDDVVTNEAGHREATAQLAEIGTARKGDLPTLGEALAKDATGPGTIDLALRYRTANERSLFRTLRELRELQAARTRS